MRQCFLYDSLYMFLTRATHCLYFIFYMKIYYVVLCKYNTIQYQSYLSWISLGLLDFTGYFPLKFRVDFRGSTIDVTVGFPGYFRVDFVGRLQMSR